MRIKYTHLIVVVLVVLSGALAYDAFTSYINPYLTTSQVVRDNQAYLNKRVQILGTIVNGSTQIRENGTLIFNLTDGKTTIKVSYQGNPPQNFREGEQVVVIGELVSFCMMEASQILVKCPSKYESGGDSLLAEPIFLTALLLGLAAIIYFTISIVFKKMTA